MSGFESANPMRSRAYDDPSVGDQDEDAQADYFGDSGRNGLPKYAIDEYGNTEELHSSNERQFKQVTSSTLQPTTVPGKTSFNKYYLCDFCSSPLQQPSTAPDRKCGVWGSCYR